MEAAVLTIVRSFLILKLLPKGIHWAGNVSAQLTYALHWTWTPHVLFTRAAGKRLLRLHGGKNPNPKANDGLIYDEMFCVILVYCWWVQETPELPGEVHVEVTSKGNFFRKLLGELTETFLPFFLGIVLLYFHTNEQQSVLSGLLTCCVN